MVRHVEEQTVKYLSTLVSNMRRGFEMLTNRWLTSLIVFLALHGLAGAENRTHILVSKSGAPILAQGTPAFNVSPSGTIDVGPSAVGVEIPHSGAVSMQISNTGTANLMTTPSFSSMEYGFTAESNYAFPVTILAGATKLTGILFKPQTAGPRPAQFMSTDNAPGSPHIVQLTGTGVNVAPNDFGLALDSAVAAGVPPGKTTSFNVWILAGPGLTRASGGTLQCSGGPGGTGCTLASSTFDDIDDADGFSNKRTSVAVTVTIPPRTAGLQQRPGVFWWSMPAVCVAVLAFGRRGRTDRFLLMAVLLLGSTFVISCGGSSSATKNNPLVLTATRNGTTHTMSIPLSAQ
jgi:hypothetical protein